MPTEIKRTGRCLNCKIDTDGILYRQFNEAGAESFFFKCPRCESSLHVGEWRPFVPKSYVKTKLTPEQIFELPYAEPRTGPDNRCARCGERASELHHWAPRAIFGQDEAERWPKDYLCKPCHDLWHKTVTPNICDL